MLEEHRVTRLHIRRKLSELDLPDIPTNEQIDEAMSKVDQEALFHAERDKMSLVIWDKTSPINAVAAEKVLASRQDIPEGGEVYLIMEGDGISIFQPHPPGVGGMKPMTEADCYDYGNRHIDEMAEHRSAALCLEQILNLLV